MHYSRMVRLFGRSQLPSASARQKFGGYDHGCLHRSKSKAGPVPGAMTVTRHPWGEVMRPIRARIDRILRRSHRRVTSAIGHLQRTPPSTACFAISCHDLSGACSGLIGTSLLSLLHRGRDGLCDVLFTFAPGAKPTLHEHCRVMGLPRKPDGMYGEEIEQYHRDGRI